MRVEELELLKQEEIIRILEAALKDTDRGLGELQLEYEKGVLELIADTSGGDARIAREGLGLLR